MTVTAPPRPPVLAPPPAPAPPPDPEALIEEARRRARRRRAIYGALAVGVALGVGAFFGGGQGGLFHGRDGSGSQSSAGSPGSRSGSSHHDRSVLLAGLRSQTSLLVVRPWLARGWATTSREGWRSGLLELARISPKQVFPSPGREALLKRLKAEAREHHFQVVSVELLHPRQFAPVVVVRTTEYVAFASAANGILGRLGQGYEGFYLEAEDEFGVPFLSVHILARSVRDPEEFPSWGLPFVRSDPLKEALQRGYESTWAAPAPTKVTPTPGAPPASTTTGG